MNKYAKYFVLICVFAVVFSFVPTGQAADWNKAPMIQTPKQLGTASFTCTNGVCSCSGSGDCVDLSKSGACDGAMHCTEDGCNCTYNPSGPKESALQ